MTCTTHSLWAVNRFGPASPSPQSVRTAAASQPASSGMTTVTRRAWQHLPLRASSPPVRGSSAVTSPVNPAAAAASATGPRDWVADSGSGSSACSAAVAATSEDQITTIRSSEDQREEVQEPAAVAQRTQQQGPQDLQAEEQLQQENQEQQPQQQEQQQPQLRHGPGICACCWPGYGAGTVGEAPTQIITYVDGVVLEVETADGTVVHLDEQLDEQYGCEGQYGSVGAGRGGGGGAGPLVYVPDLVIPPQPPVAPDSPVE